MKNKRTISSPAFLAALSLGGLLSAQGAGPIKSLPGDTAVQAAVGIQASPILSAGADSTLLVWSDTRSDQSSAVEQTGRDIYASRLDDQGGHLDPTPIAIVIAHGEQTNPRVAWDGQQWLVTWTNQTATQSFYDYRVFGTRVSADGTVLDEPFEILAPGGNSTVDYDLASNGTGWVVIAQSDTGSGIVGTRVSAAGDVVDPVPITLVPPTFFLYFNIQFESAGGEYLLTWDGTQSSLDDWQAQRFDSALAPIGPTFIVPIGSRVHGGPASYLLASNGQSSITARRMAPDGTLLDPTPIQVTSPGIKGIFGIDMTFDGTFWWLAYDVGGVSVPELRASRVGQDGSAPDPTGLAAAPIGAPLVSTIGPVAGGGMYAVWSENQKLRANRLGADLGLGSEFPLALSAASQEFVDSEPFPGGHALVWTSYTGEDSSILVQFVDEYGRSTEGPLTVATGAVGVARVAWNGALFLVTWSESSQVFGRRILPDGTFLDPAPLFVMNGFSPDAGALGSDFLVAATYYFPGLGIHFVHPYFMRLDGTTGALLDPEPQLIGQYYARYPRVAAADGKWLITWQRNFSHDDPASEVRAVFVEPNGAAGADFNVGFGGTPRVAVSDTNAMFVYRSGTSSSSNHEVFARMMALDGTFESASFTAITAADKQQRADITWTGSDYLVVWEDMRESVVFFDERTDIYGARFSASGAALDGNGGALLATDLPVKLPAVTTSGGIPLLTASAFDTTPGTSSYRLRSTVVGSWRDAGFGLAGSSGPIHFDATGDLAAGSSVTFHTDGLPPSSFGLYVVGTSQVLLPVAGGTLVPNLNILVPLATGSGVHTQTFPISASMAGIEIAAQAWVADAGAAFGFSSSNALTASGQ